MYMTINLEVCSDDYVSENLEFKKHIRKISYNNYPGPGEAGLSINRENKLQEQ